MIARTPVETVLPQRADIEIVGHLVARDFRVRYRRSIVGWLWSVVQPVTRLVILTFIFTRAIPLDIENYTAFLFVGILSWQWFSMGLSGATGSLVASRTLLLRPGFHRTIIPVVPVLTAGVEALVGLFVLLGYVALTTGLSASALLLPVVVLMQFMLMFGAGLLLCVANVYARDVRLLVDLVLQVGFYLTPIFYSLDALPNRIAGFVGVNPMTWVVEAQRAVLLEGAVPRSGPMVALAVTSTALMVIGLLVFNRTSSSVIDEL